MKQTMHLMKRNFHVSEIRRSCPPPVGEGCPHPVGKFSNLMGAAFILGIKYLPTTHLSHPNKMLNFDHVRCGCDLFVCQMCDLPQCQMGMTLPERRMGHCLPKCQIVYVFCCTPIRNLHHRWLIDYIQAVNVMVD